MAESKRLIGKKNIKKNKNLNLAGNTQLVNMEHI
jgi:hypothetical protein